MNENFNQNLRFNQGTGRIEDFTTPQLLRGERSLLAAENVECDQTVHSTEKYTTTEQIYEPIYSQSSKRLTQELDSELRPRSEKKLRIDQQSTLHAPAAHMTEKYEPVLRSFAQQASQLRAGFKQESLSNKESLVEMQGGTSCPACAEPEDGPSTQFLAKHLPEFEQANGSKTEPEPEPETYRDPQGDQQPRPNEEFHIDDEPEPNQAPDNHINELFRSYSSIFAIVEREAESFQFVFNSDHPEAGRAREVFHRMTDAQISTAAFYTYERYVESLRRPREGTVPRNLNVMSREVYNARRTLLTHFRTNLRLFEVMHRLEATVRAEYERFVTMDDYYVRSFGYGIDIFDNCLNAIHAALEAVSESVDRRSGINNPNHETNCKIH